MRLHLTRTGRLVGRADHGLGRESRWKTKSAGRERFMSVPSDEFRDNYERAFGHS